MATYTQCEFNERPMCASITLDGSHCKSYAMKDCVFCYNHNNDNIQMRILKKKIEKYESRLNGYKYALTVNRNSMEKLNEKYETKCEELSKVKTEFQDLQRKYEKNTGILKLIIQIMFFSIYIPIVYHIIINRYVEHFIENILFVDYYEQLGFCELEYYTNGTYI